MEKVHWWLSKIYKIIKLSTQLPLGRIIQVFFTEGSFSLKLEITGTGYIMTLITFIIFCILIYCYNDALLVRNLDWLHLYIIGECAMHKIFVGFFKENFGICYKFIQICMFFRQILGPDRKIFIGKTSYLQLSRH